MTLTNPNFKLLVLSSRPSGPREVTFSDTGRTGEVYCLQPFPKRRYYPSQGPTVERSETLTPLASSKVVGCLRLARLLLPRARRERSRLARRNSVNPRKFTATVT
ncbi:hypothetical protein PoB_000144700 [Plakobranchus ocellatus]|uniref:Uncharacterized protein n=1 Tax=Plakobranchus ocellatus TaxID=259542 RepID=A0AAV3XWV4_9GAST|nr:hypothetical protein PoB_000144700 [Plakobranchus ocellatus]